jgi:uncharacterized lipoprotein YmbA
MPRFALLLGLALLAGCSAAAPKPVVFACPALRSYPPAEQHQAARELAALSPGAELRAMMRDYLDLRNQVRACER